MQNMNKNSINGHIKAHLDYKFLFDCAAKGFAMMKMPGLPKLCSMTDAAPSYLRLFAKIFQWVSSKKVYYIDLSTGFM